MTAISPSSSGKSRSSRGWLRGIVITGVIVGLMVNNSSWDTRKRWFPWRCTSTTLKTDDSSSPRQVPLGSNTPADRSVPSAPGLNGTKTINATYVPAAIEQYVLDNLGALGYQTKTGQYASGCSIWRSPNLNISPQLTAYRAELRNYSAILKAFQLPTGVTDLRLLDPETNPSVCQSVELHPDGLEGLFPSRQLSRTVRGGWTEPLMPPMRHPEWCIKQAGHTLNLEYLVHDFAALCRALKRTSRIVLVDMGASLTFGGQGSAPKYLMNLYAKFGMPFDHIYAYEATPTDSNQVYKAVPEHLLSSYHWYNVAVTANPSHRNNPLKMILRQFTPDDLVVVKLDVDTPDVENPLARQLLETPGLAELVDHFYFEHHVHLKELQGPWGKSVQGSIADTVEFFHDLRVKGVASHFWV